VNIRTPSPMPRISPISWRRAGSLHRCSWPPLALAAAVRAATWSAVSGACRPGWRLVSRASMYGDNAASSTDAGESSMTIRAAISGFSATGSHCTRALRPAPAAATTMFSTAAPSAA
jgi:hypothetical protein